MVFRPLILEFRDEMLCYFYYVVVNFLKTAKANKIHLVIMYIFKKKKKKCQMSTWIRKQTVINGK